MYSRKYSAPLSGQDYWYSWEAVFYLILPRLGTAFTAKDVVTITLSEIWTLLLALHSRGVFSNYDNDPFPRDVLAKS